MFYCKPKRALQYFTVRRRTALSKEHETTPNIISHLHRIKMSDTTQKHLKIQVHYQHNFATNTKKRNSSVRFS